MGGGRAPLRHPLPLVAALTLGATGALPVPAPPEVEVTAIPEFASIAPGGALRVAVRLDIPDGYHISWVNPGETGLPTTIAWRAPRGVSVGETEWPFPEREETEGIVGHVYRGVVVVFTRFTVDSSAPRGTAVLRAELRWGICGANCVPQRKTIEASLPVRAQVGEITSQWRTVASSLERLPTPSTGLEVHGVASEERVRLTIAGSALDQPSAGTATFFPQSSGAAVVVPVERSAGGVALTLPARALPAQPRRLTGVLVGDRPWLAGSGRRALTIDVFVRAADQVPPRCQP